MPSWPIASMAARGRPVDDHHAARRGRRIGRRGARSSPAPAASRRNGHAPARARPRPSRRRRRRRSTGRREEPRVERAQRTRIELCDTRGLAIGRHSVAMATVEHARQLLAASAWGSSFSCSKLASCSARARATSPGRSAVDARRRRARRRVASSPRESRDADRRRVPSSARGERGAHLLDRARQRERVALARAALHHVERERRDPACSSDSLPAPRRVITPSASRGSE